MHFGNLFSSIENMRKKHVFIFVFFKLLELLFFFTLSGLYKLVLPCNRATLFSLRLVKFHKQHLHIPHLHNRV